MVFPFLLVLRIYVLSVLTKGMFYKSSNLSFDPNHALNQIRNCRGPLSWVPRVLFDEIKNTQYICSRASKIQIPSGSFGKYRNQKPRMLILILDMFSRISSDLTLYSSWHVFPNLSDFRDSGYNCKHFRRIGVRFRCSVQIQQESRRALKQCLRCFLNSQNSSESLHKSSLRFNLDISRKSSDAFSSTATQPLRD